MIAFYRKEHLIFHKTLLSLLHAYKKIKKNNLRATILLKFFKTFLPGLCLFPKSYEVFCAVHSLWASINSFGQQIQDVQIKFHKPIFFIQTPYISTGQKVKVPCVSAGAAAVKTKHNQENTHKFGSVRHAVTSMNDQKKT